MRGEGCEGRWGGRQDLVLPGSGDTEKEVLHLIANASAAEWPEFNLLMDSSFKPPHLLTLKEFSF